MFNPNQEDVASGFPIDPPRPSQVVEAASMDSHEQVHKRASHSGPLVHRAAWSKAGKNMDEAPKISNGADLSTVSSLVAARRSVLSEDHREKSGPSQQDVPKLITRFAGSFKESSETLMKQDQKIHTQSRQNEDGRNSSKDPVLVSGNADLNTIATQHSHTVSLHPSVVRSGLESLKHKLFGPVCYRSCFLILETRKPRLVHYFGF